MPDQAADDDRPDLDRAERLRPLAQRHGHRLPGLRGGGGELVAYRAPRRSGTRTWKHSTVTTVPMKMPANWARNCLPRVGAQQVAALQVGQQVGRRRAPPRR